MVTVSIHSGAPCGCPSDIRADERWTALPIVTMTPPTSDTHRNDAMSLCAKAFLGKPDNEDELRRRVAAFAQRRSVR